MEIYQLRTFVTVAKLCHVTRAAERLHLTQPAASGHIKALERELGVALFQRAQSGVALTREGELLIREAETALAAVAALASRARAVRGQITGRVRLGTLDDAELIRIGPFVTELLRAHPLVELRVQNGRPGWVMEGVQSAALDAGYFIGACPDPAVATLELRQLTYRVVAPRQRAEEVRAAGWREIAAMPWIGGTPQSALARLLSDLFREHGAAPRPAIEADEESCVRSLVAAGAGLCLMREETALAAAQSGELVLWEQGRARVPLSFVYPAGCEREPLLAAMLGVLRRLWAEPEVRVLRAARAPLITVIRNDDSAGRRAR